MKGLHTQGLFESLLTTLTAPDSSVEVVSMALTSFSPCSPSSLTLFFQCMEVQEEESSEKQADDLVMLWLPILTLTLDHQDPPWRGLDGHIDHPWKTSVSPWFTKISCRCVCQGPTLRASSEDLTVFWWRVPHCEQLVVMCHGPKMAGSLPEQFCW